MATKNKVTDYQMKRMRESISSAFNLNQKIDPEINNMDLYDYSITNKLFEKFKSLFKYAVFKTGKNSIAICAYLEFEFKDKDTIKVNEEVSKTIEFLEKIFIFLDGVKIVRASNETTHYVIIKVIKNDLPEHLIINKENKN